MTDHALRAIAFLDLCGYTRLTAAHGDAAAVEVVVQLRTVVRAEAADADVEIVKWLGDGVMLASEDEETILACAARIRCRFEADSSLRIRVGVATGSVRRLERDYLGSTVNRAARLCQHAAPGEVKTAGTSARRGSTSRDLVIASLLRRAAG